MLCAGIVPRLLALATAKHETLERDSARHALHCLVAEGQPGWGWRAAVIGQGMLIEQPNPVHKRLTTLRTWVCHPFLCCHCWALLHGMILEIANRL